MQSSLSDAEKMAKNLRELCSQQPSVSRICREIGLNRQQFDRYLKGRTMPSAYNMRRICTYFGIGEEDLLGEPRRLRRRLEPLYTRESALEQALSPEPGEIALLSNYAGLYFYFFLSPNWPGQVQCGLMTIATDEKEARTRYLGRVWDPDFRKIIRSRFIGRIVLRGDRLFILEHSSPHADSLGQTILYAAHQHQSNYITGMCFGIDWQPQRAPFASPVIMKRLSNTVSLRESVRACGLYDPDSRLLDPIVRNAFSGIDAPFLYAPDRGRSDRAG